MADAPSTYPLAWPTGRPRTKYREAGKFSTVKSSEHGHRFSGPLTLTVARARLIAELDRLHAKSAILSSNVELRLDGAPRADRGNPGDPGVAVYFQLDGKPIVLACDRFTEVAQNVAAIAAHIEATRRIDRYGVGTTEQMFTGFLRLAAPLVVDDWRGTLGNPSTLAEAEAAYRERMLTAHPDHGGSQTTAAALNAAIDRAREVMGNA